MVNERTKRRNLIVVLIVIEIIVGVVCVYFFTRKDSEVSFEANDTEFFRQFATVYETDEEYEFYSLDAYYLSDTGTFYYNAKYKSYSSIDETWYDVDEVMYGSEGHFENSYCLSWDELYGFEEVDKEFKRAQKEGIHKTYTEKELDKLLDKAYKTKEAELSKN